MKKNVFSPDPKSFHCYFVYTFCEDRINTFLILICAHACASLCAIVDLVHMIGDMCFICDILTTQHVSNSIQITMSFCSNICADQYTPYHPLYHVIFELEGPSWRSYCVILITSEITRISYT